MEAFCLIWGSFLDHCWTLFCNCLFHCAEICIFQKTTALSAFCLVFEVQASLRGVFFRHFSALFCGLLRGRVSDLVFIDFWLHFEVILGSKSDAKSDQKRDRKREPKRHSKKIRQPFHPVESRAPSLPKPLSLSSISSYITLPLSQHNVQRLKERFPSKTTPLSAFCLGFEV